MSAREGARIVKNASRHFQGNEETQHLEDAAVRLRRHPWGLGRGRPGARSADGLINVTLVPWEPRPGHQPCVGSEGWPQLPAASGASPRAPGSPCGSQTLQRALCTHSVRGQGGTGAVRGGHVGPGGLQWTSGVERVACWQRRADSSRVRGPSSGASPWGGDPGRFDLSFRKE